MFDPVEESQNANLCADRDVPTFGKSDVAQILIYGNIAKMF